MKVVHKIILSVAAVLLAAGGVWWWLARHTVAVLSPVGTIADEQKQLMVFASLLSIIVIVPVFTMLAIIVWRYRAGNKRARYTPEWDGNRLLEAVWWLIPLVLIAVLSVIIWTSSHRLDPYRRIATNHKQLEVQVIALEWKWLFIYPEQNVATINYLPLPTNQPVHFTITADAPMNSFWIPRLGGQVYAMSGMSTQLSLMASTSGTYDGSSANLSGEGFAGMKFTAAAMSDADFTAWAKRASQTSPSLTSDVYAELAKPSKNAPRSVFTDVAPGLYDTVVMSYMMPHASLQDNEYTQTSAPAPGAAN